MENWFLSLPHRQLLPTRPRLVYYPEIYRIVIITVKEANLEFFCSYDQGCLDDDGERNGGAIQEIIIMRNIRMFFPKLSREWRLYEEAMNLKEKRHALSLWMRTPVLCNTSSSVIITCWINSLSLSRSLFFFLFLFLLTRINNKAF